MTTVRKFLFETNFDEPESVRDMRAQQATEAAVPPPPTFSEEEMEAARVAARQAGLSEGIAKGRAEAEAKIEKGIASALAGIEKQMHAMAETLVMTREAIAGSSIEVAMAMLRKLYPALDQRGDLAEIEAVARRALQDMRHEPRLTVHVAPTLLPGLQARLTAMAEASGFDGRLVLLGDDTLGLSDCRVSWANGGIERRASLIWNEIEAAIGRCLASNGLTLPLGDPNDQVKDDTVNPTHPVG